MNIDKISVGHDAPWDVNAIIEISQGGMPVKYEMDKESGALFVDRFLYTSMYYPGNYGFVPHTLADDGDPCDILVVGPTPVYPGDKLHPFYANVASYKQMPEILINQISHFFQHYKDLEKGKTTNIVGWGDAEVAAQVIREGQERLAKKLG